MPAPTEEEWKELREQKSRRLEDAEIDPKRLLDHAVAFLEAAHRCERNIPLQIRPDKSDFLRAQQVVCASFAVELYLKLILLLRTGSIDRSKHDLLSLYNLLDDDIKSMSNSYYNHHFGIETVMNRHSKAFIDWRYIHEYEWHSASPDELAKVARALHQTVRDIKPDLISKFEE